MSLQKEIDAMGTLATLLDELEDGERSRALKWLSSRYGVSRESFEEPVDLALPLADPTDFASFFNAASPKTENEKVLVAGYWFQKMQQQPALESATINTELGNLGHPISNITRSFDRLKGEKPALALQLQKAGKAKQGRKKYRLTHEGLITVERLIDDNRSKKRGEAR